MIFKSLKFLKKIHSLNLTKMVFAMPKTTKKLTVEEKALLALYELFYDQQQQNATSKASNVKDSSIKGNSKVGAPAAHHNLKFSNKGLGVGDIDVIFGDDNNDKVFF